MPTLLHVRDEQPGAASVETQIPVQADTLTVAQLIEARVRARVASVHARTEGRPQRPRIERLLRPKPRTPQQFRPTDAEIEVYNALAAFQKGHFFVLVDDRQVERLTDEVQITPNTVVTFLRLVPLVGG